VYRGYVYTNHINDFGIADSSPNFFAGLIAVFTYFLQKQKESLLKYSIFTLVGLVGYELIQENVFRNNVFDLQDIIASVLGVFIGYLCCLKLSLTSLVGFKKTRSI